MSVYETVISVADILWWPLAAIILTQALLGPFLVRFTAWARRKPNITPTTLAGLPESVAERIMHSCAEVESLGFRTVGLFAAPDWIPKVYVRFVLLVKPEDKTWAMVTVITSASILRTHHVEFCTEFSDETELCTNNAPQLPSFAELPYKQVSRFPKLKDVRRLYDAHIHLKATRFGNKTPILNGVGEEVQYMESALTKDFERQADAGYYYLQTGEEKFFPTWKGAVLMTWKIMWPVGAVRRILIRMKANSILQEMGVASTKGST